MVTLPLTAERPHASVRSLPTLSPSKTVFLLSKPLGLCLDLQPFFKQGVKR